MEENNKHSSGKEESAKQAHTEESHAHGENKEVSAEPIPSPNEENAKAGVSQSKETKTTSRFFHPWSKRSKIMGMVTGVVLLIAIIFVGMIDGWPINSNADSSITTPKVEKKQKELTITLINGKKEWKVNLREMGYTGKDGSKVNAKQWTKWIDSIKKEVDQPAKDAHATRYGEEIKPERMGWKLDTKELLNWPQHIKGKVNGIHPVPLISDAPQVTTEDIKHVNGERIGHYVTYFNSGNVNRTVNVRLSAQAINHHIVNPGEVFSYNKTVGERTAARGYKESIIIVKGAYEKGLGGGVCQTSSTLYNSVDSAGLPSVARFSHSKEVSYVPKGRDATVAWYGPDYRFRNNLDKPVMIRTRMMGGSLTVDIYTVPGTYHHPRGVQSAPTKVHDIQPPQ
ncbi:VanW family protein [Marininema halotolerans]|uniref:Putative peptidoglycan binding domain-containing protein n=1 Tax=Marininema halotolerans TaxID=1155944 RepID=A0A1I6NQH0_9BACL|nr:VanW family protein [Marininema halotolerans]SFS30226.1 Putative peptidoglycan binding domain-containing protein [Marininema halotolerans]